MSHIYKMAIYAAVGSLHFRRSRIPNVEKGETPESFAPRIQPIIDQVMTESLEQFDYQLSVAQIGMALAAYIADPM